MKKIGIIGCGVISSSIVDFIDKELKKKAKIVALCDIDVFKAESLSKKIRPKPAICSLDEVIKKSGLIIEAANPDASSQLIQKALKYKKDVFIMSTGGLLGHIPLLKKAALKGINVYLPSGAICGLDGLRSASIGRIDRVSLTTRKPPLGLRGAPYLKLKGIDVEKIIKDTVIFSGTAKDAVKYFPANINVSATLSLLGIGPEKTIVNIIASPNSDRNIHEVEIEGEFGKIFARTENVPSKENPKTSQLAVYSAMAKLREVL